METIKDVEKDLSTNYHDNAIYFLKENEYEKIKTLLDKDYGYLDVILKFDDYQKLYPLLQEAKTKGVIYMIITDYINNSILKNANIGDPMRDILFEGDIDKYKKSDSLIFYYDVQEELNNKAKDTKKKKARIHYLLDNVKDIELQKCINDLFVYRCGISMMGYSTDNLLSYYTSTNHPMDEVHDYRKVMTYQKINKIGGMKND